MHCTKCLMRNTAKHQRGHYSKATAKYRERGSCAFQNPKYIWPPRLLIRAQKRIENIKMQKDIEVLVKKELKGD